MDATGRDVREEFLSKLAQILRGTGLPPGEFGETLEEEHNQPEAGLLPDSN
jgi:hypothetical protein